MPGELAGGGVERVANGLRLQRRVLRAKRRPVLGMRCGEVQDRGRLERVCELSHGDVLWRDRREQRDRLYELSRWGVLSVGSERALHLSSRDVFTDGGGRVFELSSRDVFTAGGGRVCELSSRDVLVFDRREQRERVYELSRWDVFGRDRRE